MSSSRLKPLVTPSTALATSVRARPWNLPSAGSGRSGEATILPSFTSKTMPGGTRCRSVPLGPFTSTAPGWTPTVTPAGTGMGFLSIRDMSNSSPDGAEHFAADAGLHRIAARHHAPRRTQDRRAEPAEHLRDLVAPDVGAAAWAAHPLDPGDHVLAAGAVLELNPDDLGPAGLGRHLPEAGNVALLLENPRDLELEARSRDVDAGMTRANRVADAREHVCDRVGHVGSLSSRTHRLRSFLSAKTSTNCS